MSPTRGERSFSIRVKARLCTERDLEALEWFGMFQEHRSLIHQAYRRQRSGEVEMLVADLNGFPVAQAWLDFGTRAPERTCIVWAVRVFPILQRVGIGTWLLSQVERRVRARGYDVVELGVERTNTEARRLYERLGFHVFNELRQPYSYERPSGGRAGAVSDLFLLRKKLATTRAG